MRRGAKMITSKRKKLTNDAKVGKRASYVRKAPENHNCRKNDHEKDDERRKSKEGGAVGQNKLRERRRKSQK